MSNKISSSDKINKEIKKFSFGNPHMKICIVGGLEDEDTDDEGVVTSLGSGKWDVIIMLDANETSPLFKRFKHALENNGDRNSVWVEHGKMSNVKKMSEQERAYYANKVCEKKMTLVMFPCYNAKKGAFYATGLRTDKYMAHYRKIMDRMFHVLFSEDLARPAMITHVLLRKSTKDTTTMILLTCSICETIIKRLKTCNLYHEDLDQDEESSSESSDHSEDSEIMQKNHEYCMVVRLSKTREIYEWAGKELDGFFTKNARVWRNSNSLFYDVFVPDAVILSLESLVLKN